MKKCCLRVSVKNGSDGIDLPSLLSISLGLNAMRFADVDGSSLILRSNSKRERSEV